MTAAEPHDPRASRIATALVLSGGGARGAYQAGVLRGLLDLGLLQGDSRVDVVVGASAGALNGAALAAFVDRPGEGIATLERLWSTIEPQRVFRTDVRSLGGIGARWVRDLSFGGVLRHVAPKALLDTAPLRALLAEHVPFERIDANVESGALRALAIPATNLYTADGVFFVDTRADVPLWRRGRFSVERTQIRVEHLMASSAIPIFFPSIEIEGRHFGDGSIRNTAPLSPAIHLGAERIVAVGVRRAGLPAEKAVAGRRAPPTIAQIAGALLDAVMLDAIEVDVEHSDRVNASVLSYATGDPRKPFRWIDVLWLSPSCGFAKIAAELADHIPAVVRYLMRGLGPDDATSELTSYLLFDGVYCSRLMAIGRADVQARRDEILAFFARPPAAERQREAAPNGGA
jgi:NTE family protein